MAKKIGILADIHGNILALEAVLKELDALKISRENTYVLGDLVGYGPRPNEVLDCLKKEGITSILGNYDEAVGFYLPTCGCKENSAHDKMLMENSLGWTAKVVTQANKAYLRELEETLAFECEGVKICLSHGSPFSINEYVYENDTEKHEDIVNETDCQLLAMGHTHIPYIKQVGQKRLVNPGSVGRPKDGDVRASFCVLTIDSELKQGFSLEIVRVPYDHGAVAREIRKSALLNVFAQHIEKARA